MDGGDARVVVHNRTHECATRRRAANRLFVGKQHARPSNPCRVCPEDRGRRFGCDDVINSVWHTSAKAVQPSELVNVVVGKKSDGVAKPCRESMASTWGLQCWEVMGVDGGEQHIVARCNGESTRGEDETRLGGVIVGTAARQV